MQPFSSASNHLPTEIYTSEKAPLLPLSSQLVQPPVDCKTRTKLWLKEHVPRALLYGFIFYFIFEFMQSSYMKNNYRGDVSINQSRPEFSDDILAYNHKQFIGSATDLGHSACIEEPSIPYAGLSEFHFNQDTFPRLSIDQRTLSHRGSRISINRGNTEVIVDKETTDVSVKFDVTFNNEDLQDVFWIDQIEDEKQGLYTLIIKTDETYTEVSCITIDITVRVPNVDALRTLAISLANSGISLGEGLIFEELYVSVANGHIEFNDGINTGKTAFAVANGHVSGTIDTLSNGLNSSIANGHNEIVVKEINQNNNDSVHIKLSIANGHNNLELPSSFNSRFSLSSFTGRRTIDSSKPEKIHRQRGGWGLTAGYYGDNKDTKNTVKMDTSNGSNRLIYQ